MNIVVIGGGAAGFFAAIVAAEAGARVAILERGNAVLQKVRISGGGRCNVTHACFDARALVQHYPRGSRELLGPFSRFGPKDTVEWFAQRGVRLKTEDDGRMFPVSDDSQTIVECLWNAAKQAGVQVRTGVRVERIEQTASGWLVHTGRHTPEPADRVLLAGGSSEGLWAMLADLGHTIVPPVPSLFTFNCKDTRLRDLAGVSVREAGVEISGTKLAANGPVLVTHWGLSGPAILRLSAWGARILHDMGYQFTLSVNWLGSKSSDEIGADLNRLKMENARKQIGAHAQFGLPVRLWERLVESADIPPDLRWGDASRQVLARLAEALGRSGFAIRGKSTFKEEFVTAGGVSLREVHFKTFESRLFPGLYFAGETLDIDAITGGFNFQAAWTGGWIAGHAMTGQSD
ncbi:MAG: NAD(P)/FAD-dependent oxidoreductase [Saprospiraceae bacterium]|jgi:predicted Rossmann fold flavoprotein|nr:NAD(P)/FAD-dependent oxidoreductase [Saprospiraceae bacterium]